MKKRLSIKFKLIVTILPVVIASLILLVTSMEVSEKLDFIVKQFKLN